MSNDDNIEKLPLREDLPKEIAAMSLPGDDDGDDPTIIINAKEERARNALRYLRPHILIPVLLGWAAAKLRDLSREQLAAVAVGAAVVSVGAAIVTSAQMTRDRPDAAERVVIVTPPAATYTVTTTPETPAPATSRWTVPPHTASAPPQTIRSLRPPASRHQPARSRTARPAPRTPRPETRRPRTRTPIASSAPTLESAAEPEPVPTAAPPPAAETSAFPPADVPDQGSSEDDDGDAPVGAAGGCDGVVHVDLDPIADVCLLG